MFGGLGKWQKHATGYQNNLLLPFKRIYCPELQGLINITTCNEIQNIKNITNITNLNTTVKLPLSWSAFPATSAHPVWGIFEAEGGSLRNAGLRFRFPSCRLQDTLCKKYLEL